VTCDIPLESSRRGLQLCLGSHHNQRSAREVMPLKVVRVPIVGISRFTFGSPGTKSHLDVVLVKSCRIYYKGEGGGFPQVWAVVCFVSPNCQWLVLTPKVPQLCTNHLVLVLCRSVWVFEAFHFFLVPSWSSITPLYPSKVLRAMEHAPTPCLFIVFSLGLHVWVSERV
jgi:hypothetical protein